MSAKFVHNLMNNKMQLLTTNYFRSFQDNPVNLWYTSLSGFDVSHGRPPYRGMETLLF